MYNTSCSNIKTIPQFKGTCWFNSLLMIMWYSKMMRNFFIKHLDHIENILKDKPVMLKMIYDLLKQTYSHDDNDDSKFFNELRPENILNLLNKIDSKVFFVKKEYINLGFTGENYMRQFFKYFKLESNILFFDYVPNNKYSLSFNNLDVNKIKKTKDSFILYHNDSTKVSKNNAMQYFFKINKLKWYGDASLDKDFSFNKLRNMKMSQKIEIIAIKYMENDNSVQNELVFENCKFILDAVFLSNFNHETCNVGHQIAGITCNDEKYLYNGWINETVDPAKRRSTRTKKNDKPCKLVQYDWTKLKNNFCIDLKKCTFPDSKTQADLCFNLSKGERTFIYVKDNIKNIDDNILKTRSVVSGESLNKPCPPNKILNPKTNRCVNIDGKIGQSIINSQNNT